MPPAESAHTYLSIWIPLRGERQSQFATRSLSGCPHIQLRAKMLLCSTLKIGGPSTNVFAIKFQQKSPRTSGAQATLLPVKWNLQLNTKYLLARSEKLLTPLSTMD